MDSDDPDSGNGGRRTERLTLDAPARLRPNSWSSVEIRMLDMSSTGFRAHCEARVRPGSAVSLDIPGIGAVEAQVEWQRGDEFGARFYGELELERCGWTLKERNNALARLLVERAAAKRAGRGAAESQLRRRILSALPMHKGSVAR